MELRGEVKGSKLTKIVPGLQQIEETSVLNKGFKPPSHDH